MRGKVWPEPFFVGPQTDFGGGLVSDCDKLWLWQKECVGLRMILWGNASDYEARLERYGFRTKGFDVQF